MLALQAAVGVDECSRSVIRERVAALADSGPGVGAGRSFSGSLSGFFAADQAAA